MRSTVWNEEIGENTARRLFETGSYLVDFSLPREKWFKWKSGIMAPCYCNCRYLNRSYEAYEESTAYFETIARLKFPDADLIVGLASAGVSWAARIAARFRLPMSFVRTVKKEHGVGGLVEGQPEKGAKAVIIDDLCGSGGTIYSAIEAMRKEFEIQTLGFITITNWCFEHMWERFEGQGLGIYSLTSFPQILRVGQQLGHLSEENAKMLYDFYLSPKKYEWPGLDQ